MPDDDDLPDLDLISRAKKGITEVYEDEIKGGFSRDFAGSEAISKIEWDADSLDLTVTFARTGQSYVYHGVPESVARGFDTAASPGSYFHAQIRGRY